jgi:transcriptional regulator with XRE-family HTH domain
MTYRYTESGLDNVLIEGAQLIADDEGEGTVTLPNVRGLHRAIAAAIVGKPSSLTGRELRFLRTELEMTQAQLARIVHREPLAISRWERGEISEIEPNAEMIVRLLARERLRLDVPLSISELASFSTPSAATPPLRIDGSDAEHYRPLPTAA